MPHPYSWPPDAKQVDKLLGVLCVRLGFCLPPDDWNRLMAEPPPDVGDFTDRVFEAEGLDPERADLRLWRQVRDVVAEHFLSWESAP